VAVGSGSIEELEMTASSSAATLLKSRALRHEWHLKDELIPIEDQSMSWQ